MSTKVSKLHQLTPAELRKQVTELDQKIALTRMKIKTKSEKNVRLLKTLRHQLARIKTVLRAKQLSS